MSKKKKFSVTGIVMVASALVCVLLTLAVLLGGFGEDRAKKNLDDQDTPGIKTVIENGSPILIFDNRSEVKKLISAFDEDQVVSIEAALGVENDIVTGTSESQDKIAEIYKALKNIVVADVNDTVTDKEDAPASADESFAVTFQMKDGSTCLFDFSSKNSYSADGRLYSTSNTDKLYGLLKEICHE